MSKNPDVVPTVPSKSNAAPSEWLDQALVLELEALLDARKALMQELQALDAQVANHFARLLPETAMPAMPLALNPASGARLAASIGTSTSVCMGQ